MTTPGDVVDAVLSIVGVGEIVGVSVLLLAVVLGVFAARRRVLQHRWPSFEASVRTRPRSMGRGWTLGIGCYEGDHLRWYRLFSFRMSPVLVLDRRTVQVTGSRCPTGPEARSLLTGHVALQLDDVGRRVELGVGEAARTHLTAWLETAARSGERSLEPVRRRAREVRPTASRHASG